MFTFDFDGIAIAYDHAGTANPVIFLHNLGGDRSIWTAQFDALQQTHSVYALDWFGYGRLLHPRQRLHDRQLPAAAEDIHRHPRAARRNARWQLLRQRNVPALRPPLARKRARAGADQPTQRRDPASHE